MSNRIHAQKIHRQVFKAGSKTYFNSSLFFPRAVRDEVSVLYAFVRVADNYVDSQPQDREGFFRFRENYRRAMAGTPADNPIIDPFVELSKLRDFDPAWTEAFLTSMEMDLEKTDYDHIDETLTYIYGSAEVIGLYMTRLMRLPPEAEQAAKMLGRSMQYINFIRDIDEDISLGRRYLPLEGSALTSLKEEETGSKQKAFIQFMQKQTGRYKIWQKEAETGYPFIPKRYRVPVKTAGDLYLWTAARIEKDPFIVYRKKVKPSKIRILATLLKNLIAILPGK